MMNEPEVGGMRQEDYSKRKDVDVSLRKYSLIRTYGIQRCNFDVLTVNLYIF